MRRNASSGALEVSLHATSSSSSSSSSRAPTAKSEPKSKAKCKAKPEPKAKAETKPRKQMDPVSETLDEALKAAVAFTKRLPTLQGTKSYIRCTGEHFGAIRQKHHKLQHED